MAKHNSTPNLPSSSRMQMPSTSGASVNKSMVAKASTGTTSRVMSAASKGGLKTKNPYGSIC